MVGVCLSVCLPACAYTGGPLEADEAAAAMQERVLKVHACQLQEVASRDHQVLCGELVVRDLVHCVCACVCVYVCVCVCVCVCVQ